MVITSINKVISMFLVGGFALITFGAVEHRRVWELAGKLATYASEHDLSWTGLVVLTLIAMPLAAFAGLLADSLSHIITRPFTRVLMKSEGASRAFGHNLLEYKQWHEAFIKANKGKGSSSAFPDSTTPYAAGLLFKSGSSDLVNWVTSHYSMHMLASDFATVLMVAFAYAALPFSTFTATPHGWMLLTIAAIIAEYLLLASALGFRLHTYEVIYRHAAIELTSHAPPPPQEVPSRKRGGGPASSAPP